MHDDVSATLVGGPPGQGKKQRGPNVCPGPGLPTGPRVAASAACSGPEPLVADDTYVRLYELANILYIPNSKAT